MTGESLKLDLPDLKLKKCDLELSKVCFMQGESIEKINRVIHILGTVNLLEEVEEHGYISNYLIECISLLNEVKTIEGIN